MFIFQITLSSLLDSEWPILYEFYNNFLVEFVHKLVTLSPPILVKMSTGGSQQQHSTSLTSTGGETSVLSSINSSNNNDGGAQGDLKFIYSQLVVGSLCSAQGDPTFLVPSLTFHGVTFSLSAFCPSASAMAAALDWNSDSIISVGKSIIFV